jgi:hypothetical protein
MTEKEGGAPFDADDEAVLTALDILVTAADGVGEKKIRGIALPIEGSLLGAVYKAGQTEIVTDPFGDGRSRPSTVSPSEL